MQNTNRETPHMREALEWLVRLRDEQCEDATRSAFNRWLQSGPEHRAAWAEAEALWESFDPVRHEMVALRQRDKAINRRHALRLLAGVAVTGAAGWHVTRPEFRADKRTAAGETRNITLADGSRVNLGGRSAFALDFSPDYRRLSLLRGEAYFSIAPDAHRPFSVAAMGAEIDAGGAGFNLRIWSDRAQLAVATHTVAIRQASGMPVRVNAGWQASFDHRQVFAKTEVDETEIGAWRRGQLIFRSVPLQDVVDELARYRGGRIAVLGKATARIPITAVFEADHPDDALRTIADSLGLTLIDFPANVAVLYS
ncbi:FecR domain-containing protein [Roseinatronobacter sp. S2]|uniref:FecR family protein n=1 Tax=Roseinatronobacter sp. S2 TaxID=3035471 RepID=UPI00241040CF|nr:FecR domain-containing protein [Roseinatronobacter sp. S2]WFE76957.1 FecR domain-containing protein [Roseinatronobacter sp. S2]